MTTSPVVDRSFVVLRCYRSPPLELVDAPLDHVAPTVSLPVEIGPEPERPHMGNNFIFNAPVSNSIVGTQDRAELTNNLDFGKIRQQINDTGGEDKVELHLALEHVERLLERGEYLNRGDLSRFSETMERHSWFTGAVMSALLGFATQIIP